MNLIAKKAGLWGFLAFFAGAFLLYSQTLHYGFVWDDFIEVAGNDVFHSWRNFPKFFTTPYWTLLSGGFAPYHRPMIPVMILAVSTFFGKNPFGYHLLNLMLHGLTCGVYFLFLRRLAERRSAASSSGAGRPVRRRFTVSRWVTWTAAVLFLFHPVHVEAVAWGSARPVLLSGLCFVSCLLFSSYLSQNQTDAKRLLTFGALLFCYSIGLLTYHSIFTLFPVVFLFHWLRVRHVPVLAFRPPRPPAGEVGNDVAIRLAEYAGIILLTGAFMIYTFVIFHRTGEVDLRPYYNPIGANIVYTGNPVELFLAPINTLSRYSELLLIPVNLVPDVYFKASALSLSAMGCLMIMALASLVLMRPNPVIFFSLVWMVFPLLTVANLVPQGGLFADRYLYIPSMGFALWAALALKALKGSDPCLAGRRAKGPFWVRPLLVHSGFVLVLAFYGFKTVSYSETWRNDMRYWLEASILAPQKARTHDKLGIALEAAGHLKEAVEEYKTTLQLDPENFVMTYSRLAEVLKKMGKPGEAQIYQEKFKEVLKTAQENKKLTVISS